jgi:hypothetical protein
MTRIATAKDAAAAIKVIRAPKAAKVAPIVDTAAKIVGQCVASPTRAPHIKVRCTNPIGTINHVLCDEHAELLKANAKAAKASAPKSAKAKPVKPKSAGTSKASTKAPKIVTAPELPTHAAKVARTSIMQPALARIPRPSTWTPTVEQPATYVNLVTPGGPEPTE